MSRAPPLKKFRQIKGQTVIDFSTANSSAGTKNSCEVDWPFLKNFKACQTPANGSCFFAAVADQLGLAMSEAANIRLQLVQHVRQHRQKMLATEHWDAIVGTHGGVEPYLELMSKQSTHADGIMIAAAVDVYKRTLIIIQDDGLRLEFTHNGDMSDINMLTQTPMFLGYVKGNPSDANRNHYLSLHPKCIAVTQHQPSEPASVGVLAAPSGNLKPPEAKYMMPQSVPLDLAQELSHGPEQPSLLEFPSKEGVKQTRRMNTGIYKQYPFIEYSVTQDAIFCFPCRMFPQSGRTEPSFTETGYNNWKKVHENIRKHCETMVHCNSMSAWHMFQQTRNTGAIDKMLDIQRRAAIDENRSYITSIAKVAVTCARQGIALRGHRETVSSTNRGNFLEIVDLIALESPTFRNKRTNAARNAQYLHHDMQNTLLDICASCVVETIVCELRASGPFSIMVDDSSDISLTEQMSICVRYVHDCDIKERFLGFFDVHQVDADGLKSLIVTTLSKLNVDINLCVAQCYDGASVMSGKAAGVQAKIREIVPSSIYIHCYSHRLNLVLIDTCKSISSVANFFGVLQLAYVFLASRSSKRHDIFIALQARKKLVVLELPELCETRWASRFACVRVFRERLDIIVESLQEIEKPTYRDRTAAAEAKGILLQLQTTGFAFHLAMFYKLLSITKPLSDVLQGNKIDISKALTLVKTSKQQIMTARTQFRLVYTEARLFVPKHCMPVQPVSKLGDSEQLSEQVTTVNFAACKSKRTSRLPSAFNDFVVTERIPSECGSLSLTQPVVPFDCSSEELEHRRIYYEVIDTMHKEMCRRFSDVTSNIMLGIEACDPSKDNFMNVDVLQPMALNYAINTDAMCAQAASIRAIVANCDKTKRPKTVGEVLKLIGCFRSGFEDIWRMLQIAITVPVTSAECERSFSVMKRIKSYLRSTMSQDRLRNISILAIERELSDVTTVNWENVIDKFSEGDRRLPLRYDQQ